MKKRILLLAVCFIASLGSWAQTQVMRVESFVKLATDQTAQRFGTRVKDHNDKVAALIKLRAPGDDYIFDNGSMGIVEVKYQPGGEIWVYIPEGSSKMTITHKKYGHLSDYKFPEPIFGGTVYEMVLNPGWGQFVNITADYAGATIWMDNDSIGVSPLNSYYLPKGRHNFKAKLGKKEGQVDNYYIGDQTRDVPIKMEDLSKYYVNLQFRVADNAEIWYDNKKVAVGNWDKELYKGEYYIETRKPDCEPRTTKVEVKPGMEPLVTLTPPVPYKGTLQLHVAPRTATILLNNTPLENGMVKQVNVGKYAVDVQRKGYHPVDTVYHVTKDATVVDTIRLQRISYVKKNQYYLGAGFTYSPLSGGTILAGATYQNFDAQLSYTLGFLSTDNLTWYYQGEYIGTMSYKQNVLAAKLGYQFKVLSRCAVVPQLGFALHSLTGTQVEGMGMTGDGAKCSCLTVGAKVLFVPSQHIGIFVNPEYALAVSKGDAYQAVADGLGMSAGGFFATAGVIVKF